MSWKLCLQDNNMADQTPTDNRGGFLIECRTNINRAPPIICFEYMVPINKME